MAEEDPTQDPGGPKAPVVTIEEMAEMLENLLHRELPNAVRTRDQAKILQVSDSIDEVQRAIGLAAFERIRRGDWGEPVGAVARRLISPPAPPEESAEELSPELSRPYRAEDAGPTAPAPRCSGCAKWSAGRCTSCSKPFCEKHLDQAFHPCGDIL
jgi:hypothetical protein